MRWNGTHITMNYNVTVNRKDNNTYPTLVNATVNLKRTNANNQSDYWIIATNQTILGPGGTYTTGFIWNETETMKPGDWNYSTIGVIAKADLKRIKADNLC